MTLRRFPLALMLVLSACGGNPRPKPPVDPPVETRYTLTLLVSDARTGAAIPTASARSGDKPFINHGDGRYSLDGLIGEVTFHVEAPGYLAVDVMDGLIVEADTTRAVALYPRPPPKPTGFLCGRLVAKDGDLRCADGRRYNDRGVTAFRVAEQVAHGREDEAIAFMTWARSRGFNSLRVFAMAMNLFVLTPADGAAAVPRVLALARAQDLYVEIVALADTGDPPPPLRGFNLTREQMRAHVSVVGAACAAADNCVFQVANEPFHATQSNLLEGDPRFLKELRALVPAHVVSSLGAWRSDETLPPWGWADIITTHPDRSRKKWERERHLREIAVVAGLTDVYAVAGEPVGFAEKLRLPAREVDPDVAFAIGALTRFFNAGAKYHCDDCINGKVPAQDSGQEKCATAFVAGATLAHPDAKFQYHNAGRFPSPVAKFNVKEERDPDNKPNSALRMYSFLSPSGNFVTAVGVNGDPQAEWAEGWKPVGIVADLGGFRVLRIAR